MTTGIMDGGYVIVSVGGTVIECLTDCTLNLSAETIDTTCKNTAGNKSNKRGAKEWSINFSGNFSEDGAGTKFSDLFTIYDAGTVAVLTYGSAQTGDTSFTGNAYLNSLEQSAGNTGALVSFSGTFTGDGTLTKSTNP